MFLCHQNPTGGTSQPRLRGGNSTVDALAKYALRMQRNGGSDDINTGESSIYLYDGESTGGFDVGYIANYSSKEKLGYAHHVGQSTAGAGYAPLRQETAFKHAFTSNQYDILSINNVYGTGDFATGSELVVLGWDPASTHTTNFWEELASVNATGSSTNLSTGTFTAKKYLWVQAWVKGTTSSQTRIRYGTGGSIDSGGNYADRYSHNGASDATDINQFTNYISVENLANRLDYFNMFIINNSANEKLSICHLVNNNATAGAGTAPKRAEWAQKWANTSGQIDIIELTNLSGNFTGGQIKVWGSN